MIPSTALQVMVSDDTGKITKHVNYQSKNTLNLYQLFRLYSVSGYFVLS